MAGLPGTGKTTLGNQLAFHHAATGGRAVVGHPPDRDARPAAGQPGRLPVLRLPPSSGTGCTYLNLFDALEQDGFDGVIAAIRRVARETEATLLVVDGATVVEDVAPSPLALRRFVQQLQAQAAILGATTVLLTGQDRDSWPSSAPTSTG